MKAAKVVRKEMEEPLTAKALKLCKGLQAICAKIDKLEKEKRKILQKILNDKPKSVSS